MQEEHSMCVCVRVWPIDPTDCGCNMSVLRPKTLELHSNVTKTKQF